MISLIKRTGGISIPQKLRVQTLIV